MQSLLFSLIDRWRAPAPDERRVAWLREADYAHRGLHGASLTENSTGAFDAAIAAGFGIECDVQRSSDGHAVVFHDFELDRLTDESGPVDGRSLDDLRRIRLRGSGETIPSLRDLLQQIKGQVPLLIEIKSRKERRIAPLCLAVRRTLEGYSGNVAVMSFDPRVPRWFGTNSPLTIRGLVVTEEDDKGPIGRIKRRQALHYARPDFLAYDIRDLPSRFAASQRRRGLPVLSWTVRSADHLERAFDHADAPIFEGAGKP